MKRVVYLSMLCCIALNHASAQNSVIDSLHKLYARIATLTEPDISCGNIINEFKLKVVGISWSEPLKIVKELIRIDSQILKAKNIQKCPLLKSDITSIDKFLSRLKPDSMSEVESDQLISALFYFKNKVSGFVLVTILPADKTTNDTLEAHISISSDEPFIVPEKNKYNKPYFEVYLRRGDAYNIQVDTAGYSALTQKLTCYSDTVLNLKLEKTAVVPVIDNIDDKKRPNQPSWILLIGSVLLGMLIYGFINRKFFSKKSGGKLIAPVVDRYPVSKPPAPVPIPEPSKTDQYFACEILMSAGPRKRPDSETDLGEDVCGLITGSMETHVWLLDGTSDSPSRRNPIDQREYFSSRLLAQSIALKLKSHLHEVTDKQVARTVMQITEGVKSDWLRNIEKLPESEKAELKNLIKEGKKLICSTTVIVAKLSIDGNLTVYRTGDSKMLLYRNVEKGKELVDSTLSKKNSESNAGIFFRLHLNSAGDLDIIYNTDPIYEVITESNIGAIIGFSDGIGHQSEKMLRDSFVRNSEIVREQLVYQMQGVPDDKSLCIIERKNSFTKVN